jgi:hypothetical protein
MKGNSVSKLKYLQAKRKIEIEIINMMKKQLHYDSYLLKNDLYLLNHERELEKIEKAIKLEKNNLDNDAEGK